MLAQEAREMCKNLHKSTSGAISDTQVMNINDSKVCKFKMHRASCERRLNANMNGEYCDSVLRYFKIFSLCDNDYLALFEFHRLSN